MLAQPGEEQRLLVALPARVLVLLRPVVVTGPGGLRRFAAARAMGTSRLPSSFRVPGTPRRPPAAGPASPRRTARPPRRRRTTPRVEPERPGRVVLAGQVGVEHRGVVGRDRAAHAAATSRGSGCSSSEATAPCGRSRAGRRRGRGGGRRAPAPAPDPRSPGSRAGSGRAEQVERAAHRLRADDLAGVRHRAEPCLPRGANGAAERLAFAKRASSPPRPTPTMPRSRYGGAPTSSWASSSGALRVDVGRQPHLDAVQLAGLLGAVAVAAEHLVPVDAAPGALDRREDRLDVDGPVPLRLGGVVDDDLAEVLLGAQAVRGQDPDLDEVGEVAEPVEPRSSSTVSAGSG